MFDDFMNFDDADDQNSFGEDPQRKWMIEQPEEMAEAVSKLVGAEAGFSNNEVKVLLSIEQIIGYFKEFGEVTEDNEIHITSANLEDVCDALQAHIIGFDLTKCAASGMLDMFWSDEQDTMMFFKPDAQMDIPRLTGPADAQAVDVGDDEEIIAEWEEAIANISDDDDEEDFDEEFEFDVDEDFFEGDYDDEEEDDDELPF